MEIREMRAMLGDTRSDFSKRYNIPVRTIQNWENGVREAPQYVMTMLEEQVKHDCVNRRTFMLQQRDPQKDDLPKMRNFSETIEWLSAVQKCLDSDVVFALDEALFCDESFLGRTDEYLVWIYGDDSLRRFNGVMVLGKEIDPLCVKTKKGIRYTDFNRTLADSLANEDILDMQGITEALSYHYFRNGESFDGICVPPEYQKRFEKLADDAVHYYSE